MALFKNRYRIESTRLKGWDYSNCAPYFITICTNNFINHFGQIDSSVSESANRTVLNQAGIIVESEWKRTETIRDNVILDEYVVMPNHFHAILIITESNKKSQPIEQISQDTLRDTKAAVPYKNQFGPQRNNLSSIVGGFKAALTSAIRYDLGLSFSWQDGFYEHIIRNEKALEKVREYIFYNPLKWKWDKYYR